MRLILITFAAAAFSLSASAQADDPFRKTFDACVAAIEAHDFPEVLSFMTAASRKQIATQIPPSQHAAFFANANATMPRSYEVESVTVGKDGKKASMLLVGMVPVSSEEQKAQGLPPQQKTELTVEFEKESGLWKIGPILFGGNPDKRPKPADMNMGRRGDYNDEANTQIGGIILRFEKQADGTVYVIRVVDEEDAVFVPADKVLPTFIPGAILSTQAAQNQKDNLKYWAESAKLVEQQRTSHQPDL